MSSFDHRFAGWLEAIESRHLADLTFSEVSRALRALSYIYVERRRGSMVRGAALSGAGKRAAFVREHLEQHRVQSLGIGRVWLTDGGRDGGRDR